MKIGRYSSPLGVISLIIFLLFPVCTCTPERKDDGAETHTDSKGRLEKLRSIPYTSVTDEEVGEAPSHVVIYDAERASPGYNLFCSRTTPEVWLIDMNGRPVHNWYYRREHPDDLCEHAIMLENGDVVVIDRFKHLLRLDWDSNIVWKTELVVHHDVALRSDSTFYTITWERIWHRGLRVRFPIIVEVTADGTPVDQWRAYDHLDEIRMIFDRRSFLDTILDSLLAHASSLEVYQDLIERGEATQLKDKTVLYDHFHLNTISLLPDTPQGERDCRFNAGNLLVCFRNVNQIAILDEMTKEILWVWGEGMLEWPHHPTMLQTGNILVFDNGAFRKYSRVIELDPISESIVWEYVADPPEDFYSYGKGSAQRLPNGNTLICEGDRGRVFEVTQDGEVVWEWLNPFLKDGRRVQIYRMTRIPRETVEPLLLRGATTSH
jgi:hypothetical protein